MTNINGVAFAGTEARRKKAPRANWESWRRTPFEHSKNVLSVVLLVAACVAQLIPGAKAQTNALERVTNATNEASQLKKAGSAA